MDTAKNTEFRKSASQITAVMAKNFTVVVFGASLGYNALLVSDLSGRDVDHEFQLNEDQISWISSLNQLFIPLGCLISGTMAQHLGRKRALLILTLPVVASYLIFKFANSVWQIYAALALTGFTEGLSASPILTYTSEVCQPYIRGTLGATTTMTLFIGILLQYLFGTVLGWRDVALVNCILPVISFGLLLLIPESPHWLIMKGKYKAAQESLAWLRGWATVEDIQIEFQELQGQYQAHAFIANVLSNEHKSNNVKRQIETNFQKMFCLKIPLYNTKRFMQKSVVWPTTLVFFQHGIVNFSGLSTLQNYAILLFAVFKTPINEYYATVLVGLVSLIGCLLCVFIIKRIGKRMSSFISLTGTCLCSVITAGYAQVTGTFFLDNSTQSSVNTYIDKSTENYSWIPLVSLILLALFSCAGLRTSTWIMVGEFFSKDTRDLGCGFSAGIFYITAFLANKVFLQMVAAFTLPGIYLFYGAVSLLGIIVLYFTLPETEGKSLQEIYDHFAGISKLDNKVRRTKKSNEPQQGVDNAAFNLEKSAIKRCEDF